MTGSNSYLLSDEITTKLTGRYLTFEAYPLDFEEYEEMKRFHRLVINEDRYEEFNEYMLNGGFPKSLEFPDINTRQVYTRGIVQEIFEKDVRTRKRISNIAVFERVQAFLINHYRESTVRIREREYRPFRSIRDGYPRYIISLDRLLDQQEGVHHINAIDLFLGKEKI